LPENAPPVAFGHERLLIAFFERELEDARDPLVVVEVPDANSPLKIQIFRLKSDGSAGKCPDRLEFFAHSISSVSQ